MASANIAIISKPAEEDGEATAGTGAGGDANGAATKTSEDPLVSLGTRFIASLVKAMIEASETRTGKNETTNADAPS